jgi:hypothetical protein
MSAIRSQNQKKEWKKQMKV